MAPPVIGKVVYLEPDDDAAGIRDRIEWAGADRVALVAPREGSPLKREIDYLLVRRAGEQAGAEVALVSQRWRDRRLARQAGLAAFGSVDSATRKRWMTPDDAEPIRRRAPPRRFRPDSLRRFYPRRNWLRLGLRLIVALAAIAVLAGAALVIAPEAHITLTASSQRWSTIVPVTLSTQLSAPDFEARAVPAQRVDVVVEDSLSTPATGAKDIPSRKANGLVTFLNALTTPYTVTKNTVVRTTSSSVAVRFVTLQDVAVPAGGRADAAVEALEAGPGGNVPASQINQVEGLPALAVRVINTAPLRGGDNQTVRSVTEADYQRARAALKEKLLVQAADRMKQGQEVVRDNLYVVPDTLFIADVQDETFDRFITEQADEVRLNMRLQVAGLAVSPGYLTEMARQALETRAPQGYSLLGVSVERGDVAEEGTGLDTVYYIVAQGVGGAEIDESAIRKAVRGKSPSDAQSTLLQMLPLRGNPQITLGPDWLTRYFNRLPFVTLRIATTVNRE